MTKTTEKTTAKKASTKAVKTDKSSTATDKTPAKDLISPNTEFNLTLAAKDIKAARSAALQRAGKQTKLEGFRHGMAPQKLIEQKLGEEKLRDLILETLLPPAYREYIQANKLVPLTDPDIRISSLPEDGDWEFTFSIAQPPTVELGEYQKVVEKIKKTSPAFTEKHDHTKDEAHDHDHSHADGHNHDHAHEHNHEETERNLKVNAILEGLLQTVHIPLPDLLVRRETDRQMNELGHQLEQLNLTVEDYLAKINKTVEVLQQETAARTILTLQVEFLLGAVVNEAKISVSDDEVKAIIPDASKVSPEQQQYVISSLLKQKAVEYLLTL